MRGEATERGRAAMALALGLLCAGVAMGCEDEPRPPAAPEPDGGFRRLPPRPGGGGGRDGGSRDGGALDASGADAGAPPSCVALPSPPPVQNRASVTRDDGAVPFSAARVFARWDRDACASPTLWIGLSDGSCEVGEGRQVLVRLSRDEIGVSVSAGENLLEAEPFDDHLAVYWVEPAGALAGEVWGTCTGSAGTVTFDDLGAAEGAALRGSIAATLTDCTDPRTSAPTVVQARFDVTLEESFAGACP